MSVSAFSTDMAPLNVVERLHCYDPNGNPQDMREHAKGKRALDFVGAFGLLLVLLPLVVFVALFAFLAQGRPVFIRHERVGRHGEKFPCFKFRTMVKDAERALCSYLEANPAAREEWAARHKLEADPRITSFGAILRKSSVDEIPQLFNVLRGEMSLVGPRPIVEGEIHFYGDIIEKYYSVRPGLTGLWQSSGRSGVGYEERVRLDEQYVNEQCLINDLLILLKTIPAVLKMRGSC